MVTDMKVMSALIEFSNILKENLDDLRRQRNYYGKGELSKKIDKLLEDYLKKLKGGNKW